MKAIQINAYGGSEVLEVNQNSPTPSLKKEQILVEVHAASINPFDAKLRAGYMKDAIPLKFPFTMGEDFAGVVKEVGADVSDFKAGDEVFGAASALGGGSGSFAQLAAVNSKNTAYKPKNISFEEAASLPLVGSSAVQALEEHMKLQKGQKILIHGGAGGIGSVAIQLAKSIGAYVATTVSTDDMDFVKNLGADEAIDYKNEKFEEKLKDYDAVFDTVGGETQTRSFKVLKKGGVLVSMLGEPSKELAKEHGVTGVGQSTDTNASHLKRLAELVGNGKIKPEVDKVYPLSDVKDAFKHLEEGSPRGKVVLKISPR